MTAIGDGPEGGKMTLVLVTGVSGAGRAPESTGGGFGAGSGDIL